MGWHETDLSVNGPAGLQLFVIIASNSVEDVGVNMADSKRLVKDGGVENQTDL